MSLYQFIASEYELPELLSPKIHRIGVEKIEVACEEDLGDLEIYPEPLEENYADIPYYTKLPYIYGINFEYTEERTQRFYQYLHSHGRKGKKLEIWTIWLANGKTKKTFRESLTQELVNLKKQSISLDALNIKHLTSIMHFHDSKEIPTPTVLQIY